MKRVVKEIPVETCVVPEIRVTAVYDDELQKLLSDSLEATGQIVPIVAVFHNDRFYISDGKHRLEDAQRRGDKTIKAVVSEGQPEDVLLLNLVTNRTRGKVKASEMVQVISELTTTYGLDSDAIRERTGFGREYIEKLWRIADTAPEVQEALDRELIGVGIAYELSRLPNHDQQAALASRAETYHSTVKEVKGFVDQVLQQVELMGQGPKDPPPPPPPRIWTCDVCAQAQEPRDLVTKQICPGCWSVAWTAARRQVHPTEPATEGGAE